MPTPSSLAWYARRLRAMSAPEIGHRVVEQGKRRLSRLQRYGWERFASHGPLPALPGLREDLLAGATPSLREAVRSSSAAILAGRFSALGVAWPRRDPDDLFPPEVWRLDPVSNTFWPGAERYCFDIAYRQGGERGDVKYVWELNRLQVLQPLAASVALDGDPRALAAIEAALASWAEANPPFRGIAWASGIELALRSVSLLLAASLCGEALSVSATGRIRAVLAAHLHWLARYPSRFSSANNHLVAEALGEFLIATAMPDLPGAGPLATRARGILEREATLQILDDGVPAEQSPTYGAFTLEMLALARTVARHAGRPMAAALDERLARFSTFVGWLADGEGRLPALGDDDEGRVVALCAGDEPDYAASVARVSAPTPAGAFRAAILRQPEPAAHESPAGLRCFARGGYTIVRETRGGRRLRLVMDHGPLGYLAIAAHGHADANAFTLDLDGAPVLVDPGTFLYGSGGAWRTWFRGTRAHNTLAVAGADQSLQAGPFNWRHQAQARRLAGTGGEAWSVSAEHDGYVGRFGTTHRRTIAAAGAGVMIRDRLLPDPGRLPVEVIFQAAPGLAAVVEGDGVILLREGREVLRLAFDARGEIAVQTGGPGHDGWVSPRFGLRLPAPRVTWRGVLARAGLTTRLTWPGPADSSPPRP